MKMADMVCLYINAKMAFRTRGAAVLRRVKSMVGQAYAAAQDMAPGVKKGAEALRKGCAHASESGLVDQVAGRHAGTLQRGARRGFDAYGKFEDAARKADGAFKAARHK